MQDDMTDRMECQICERKIKAKNGLIAHHGYTRPTMDGWGYQTDSCAGARELPYEKSCDLIPAYIKSMTIHLERLERTLAEYTDTPPATITSRSESPYQKGKFNEYTCERPEGFTTENAMDKEFWQFKSTNYPHIYRKTLQSLESAIRDTKRDLNHLNDRVKNWRMK